MRSFAFHRPNTLPEMSALLSGTSDSMPLAAVLLVVQVINEREGHA